MRLDKTRDEKELLFDFAIRVTMLHDSERSRQTSEKI